MRHSWILNAAMLVSVAATAAAAEPVAAATQAAALKALEGSVAYSHKAPYSDAIADLYLGYDATGGVVRAVALRVFKTYETVTAMAVVTRQDGAFVVTQAEIPDIAVIKSAEKQGKVLEAVKGIAGRTVRDKDGTLHGIDAITGATRYFSRIFASYDLMAKMTVEEMQRNPDWPRIPMAK